MRTEPNFHGGREWLPGVMSLGACLLTAALLTATPVHAAPVPPAFAFLQTQTGKVFTGDHTVAEGETVEDVVVVGGDLRVHGEITGDAVVVGGNLFLEPTGAIRGDAVVTGGEIHDRGGRIEGEMRMLGGSEGALSEEIARAIGADVRGEARRAGGEAARTAREAARARVLHERSWFDPIKRGFAGLISTLALGIVLAGIGAALIFYGRSYLETVSDTLRSNVLRSTGVGLAAGFLVVPAFVVLVVALAVSIIGIPLLLVAVPLYPLAIAMAVGLGLLTAAYAIGERTAEQRSDRFDLSRRNAYAYLFTGLGMLLTPLLAAHLLAMTGFLGFVGTLVRVVTWTLIWVAATAGFGAVILSRAGTRRTFVATSLDPSFDPDPFFEDEPTARGPHV